jgi:broad specificity phosphatase PhoE
MIAFVRHGQTDVNRAGQLQGRVDAELTGVGHEQAARLGRRFAAEEVRRVFASPLRRAIDTGTAIAQEHRMEVETDERLVELDYGDWDQRSMRDVPAETWAAWRSDPAFAPPGGESLLQVTARVADFCHEHLGDGLVVAVSHVSPIKAAVCWALGVDANASWRMFLDLASVTRIARRDDGPPFLLTYNEAP